MVSGMFLSLKGFKILCINECKNFFPFLLKLDSSFDIGNGLIKCVVLIIDTVMEGTVSQICYLGPSLCFM